jgi:aspartate kinase
VRTSPAHSRARIRRIDTSRIRSTLHKGMVPVVAGFQGVTDELEITTLGRGASDTSAVALAAALGARICEIHTDVEGILSADPRVVPEARLLRHISYEECLELASVGAKVMHPRAVELGELYGIPIHVRSSFHRREGTMIIAAEEVPMEERNRVRGVAHEYGVAKVTVLGVPDRPGIAAAIFEPLSDAGLSVDVIIQNVSSDGETDLTLTCSESELKTIAPLVERAAAEIGARQVICAGGAAKVSIVGTGMIGTPGIAARMFRTLSACGVNIEMISTAEIRITCLVKRDDVERAVRALHTAFELDQQDLSAAESESAVG